MVRLLTALGSWILGKGFSKKEPRADMYLPLWLLAFAIILLIAALAGVVYAIVATSLLAIILAIGALGVGVAALLCWKNQTIHMVSNDTFVYTTFLGHRRKYAFSEITGIVRHTDSLSIIARNEKIHVESCAIMTERLATRLDEVLTDSQG